MKSIERNIFEATLLISVLIALVFLPVRAWGQNPPPADQRGPIPFSTFDANGDGEVSEAEFNQARAERMAARAEQGRAMKGMRNMPTFAEIDTDGNGGISPDELTAHQKERHAQNF